MRKEGDADDKIVLSLISHTNVGKTALARTLLRRDIGEVADRAHVTVAAEAYTLIESGGRVAMLWDTPGFGANLAKLARRLRDGGNPVQWILHQVWDRWKDNSLWCSQEAIRNIQADADVVIYLVDATQSPESAGYLPLEIEILGWIGKPVLVFLNKVGSPDANQIAAYEEEWRSWLADHEIVKHVSALDAFTRCWVQEHRILEHAASVIEGAKRRTAKKLAAAFLERNRAVYEESIDVMAELVTFALTDTETLPGQNMLDRIRELLTTREGRSELDAIRGRMHKRLDERTTDAANRLIALHGIEGERARRIAETSREEFKVRLDVPESILAIAGGAATGLAGGLTADVLAGGMTFGGGAVVGMLLGGAAALALAKGYNLAQSGRNQVRWTEAHFHAQLKLVVLLYLEVAHFGRGRGTWRDPENYPAPWESGVARRIEEMKGKWGTLWKKGGATGDPDKLKAPVRRLLASLVSEELATLYPEAAGALR